MNPVTTNLMNFGDAQQDSVCHDYVEMKLQNRRSTKRIEEFTGIDLLNFSRG